VPLSTDRDVAQAMLGDLIRDRELGRANMLDPRKHHSTDRRRACRRVPGPHRMEGRSDKFMAEKNES